MKQRNAVIDFLKFIFALIIVFYHTAGFITPKSLCVSGYIGVEFFFIVSGYLLANKADREKNVDIYEANTVMIKQKIIHIFPYFFTASVLGNLIYIISNNFVVTSISDHMLYTITEFLGLQMFGFVGFIATGVSWYISVLLIISFLVYPILCKNRLKYTKYIAPLISCFILGYLACTSGNLSNPGEWLGFTFKGMLRGLADISIGCISYELKNQLDKTENYDRNILASVEVFGVVVPILFGIFHKRVDSHDFFIIPLLAISISIIFSNKSFLSKVFKAKVFNSLGIFSLSIYLNHYYVKENISKIVPNASRSELLFMFFVIVFSLSIINYVVGNFLATKMKSIRKVIMCVLIWCVLALMIFLGYQVYFQVSVKAFGGDGSQESPYIIDNATDLRKLGILVNNGESFADKYFEQTVDIDLQDKEFVPIGIFNSGKYFDGIYDGNNHVISNIRISKYWKYNNNVALFGMLSGTVENLGIESGYIEGACVGSIAGHSVGDHAKILNCYNKATISGTERAGGICDNFSEGTLVNCANFGEIKCNKVSSPICAYNARTIIGIYPEEDMLPETFDGEYVNIKMDGDSTSEILNSGIDGLKEKSINSYEIKYWNQ